MVSMRCALLNSRRRESSTSVAASHYISGRTCEYIVSELVATCEIELGMVVITQIMTTPGVELVGPIPHEVQSYVRWSGAVGTNAAAPQVARDLVKFLTGPTALPVLKTQGMAPG
jgi:ABC-type molybdate transport system substrate-binding protein